MYIGNFWRSNKIKKVGVVIEKVKGLLKNITAIVLLVLILVMVIINVSTFTKRIRANAFIKEEQRTIKEYQKTLKRDKKELEAAVKAEQEREETLIAEQTKLKNSAQEVAEISLEIDNMIAKSNKIGQKYLDKYLDKRSQELTIDKMIAYGSLAIGKDLVKKEYKGYLDFNDTSGFLKGSNEHYYFSSLNGGMYTTLLVTTATGEVKTFYIINTEDKKVEVEKSYQNIKVDIEND